MPYIPQQDRNHLDPKIKELAQAVSDRVKANGGDYEGILNYTMTKLLLFIIPEHRYKHIARITGVLENVKQEFYRRLAAPYEDAQIKKNKDVYPGHKRHIKTN